MFRIDDNDVVDATLSGNAARFINHSCEVRIAFIRVATAQGKQRNQGIWMFIFPDGENTVNLPKKYDFTQGI